MRVRVCGLHASVTRTAPFLEHGSVDYVHTSGGRTTAHSDRIRAQEPGNLLTWAELHRLSGRGIIADTGYGVGGKLTDDTDLYTAWTDVDHLRDRIADGVVGVTFANPSDGWDKSVNRLRATLPSTRHCLGPHARASRRSMGNLLASPNASSARGGRGSHATGAHHAPLTGGRGHVPFRAHAGAHVGAHAGGRHAGGGHHPAPHPILTTRAHEQQREMARTGDTITPTGPFSSRTYVLDGSHVESEENDGDTPFGD